MSEDIKLGRIAAVVRELALPAPFELSGFDACLQARTGRAARLAPVAMESGAPSGVLLRTDHADYLFYERQTTPFHQAHIALSLAAQMLLGDAHRPTIDPQLVPDVSPRLLRLMLGTAGGRPVTRSEAETFAFLALECARAAGFPPTLARRALRQLDPLHSALLRAVPEVTSPAAAGGPSGATFRLYRQVIEIRDAVLALRPFRDPEVARTAARYGRAAGQTGDELAAAVEAAVLASALRARNARQHFPDAAGDRASAPVGGQDLRTDTACLMRVSQALAGLLLGRGPAPAGVSEHGPDSAL